MEVSVSKLKYGKGRGSIEIDGLQKDLFLQTIRQAEPTIIKVLEDTTAELAKASERDWIVRNPKYGKSKGSKYMHSTGLRIIPPYTIEAFVENTAEYAWAIKVGRESTSNLREGKRLANEVLWSPAKKQSQNVVQKIADETVKKMRKL